MAGLYSSQVVNPAGSADVLLCAQPDLFCWLAFTTAPGRPLIWYVAAALGLAWSRCRHQELAARGGGQHREWYLAVRN